MSHFNASKDHIYVFGKTQVFFHTHTQFLYTHIYTYTNITLQSNRKHYPDLKTCCCFFFTQLSILSDSRWASRLLSWNLSNFSLPPLTKTDLGIFTTITAHTMSCIECEKLTISSLLLLWRLRLVGCLHFTPC